MGIHQELDDTFGTAFSLTDLGNVALEQGDVAAAGSLFRQSLAISWELETRRAGYGSRVLPACLEGLAGVAVAQGQGERAARLLGAADALREPTGAPVPPPERADAERHVAAARAALGEERFAAAWAKGRAMTVEQAIEYASAR